MRVPIPRNRLVAFTLAGAVLTAVVAVGLAFPALGLTDDPDSPSVGDSGTNTVAPDAPTPNQNFTPAVSQPSSYEEEEHEDEDEDEHEAEEEEYE
ncbi:hypothetical protein [Haloglomus salinum]|jgi:hypothetical protein|uniref:hypothetical protein n=1 Tax=Haloglomus salinum TaxID=2962673 RepID=UPI0020C9909E|nr:hypothetical protein [Haloglomus salinum]